MKKSKAEETVKETTPSPPPLPMITENTEILETESQDSGKEQIKANKRVKKAAKKKITDEKIPFKPLVLETRITIYTMEEFTLFAIQSTEGKCRPDLDRDLADVKAEARGVVPVVSKKCISKEVWYQWYVIYDV